MFFASLLIHRSAKKALPTTRVEVVGLSIQLAPACLKLTMAVGLCILAACSGTKLANTSKLENPAPSVVLDDKYVPTLISLARTPKDYRHDAAHHIYGFNQHRIHKGKLPPLLYAIGVVTFEVREDGKIESFDWMRKPKQAPEVVQEIERTIKAAEPFPAPIHLGRVRYTETWLWQKSGKFQLDTLTEGQI